jgi:hypothetical protein
MIRRDHKLPIKRQAALLGIRRGTVYYVPRTASPEGLRLMREIDELNMEPPFAGAHVTRHAEGTGLSDRAQARQDPDAADGDRSPIPAAEHEP